VSVDSARAGPSDDDNDLDYYVYELGRLQAVGRSVVKAFGAPAELVAAREEFEQAIPHLKGIRDPLRIPTTTTSSTAWCGSALSSGFGATVAWTTSSIRGTSTTTPRLPTAVR
jgi:hypothetical protein